MAQLQMENLGRGIVAVKQTEGSVFVSWRPFGTDPADVAFNLYRTAHAATAVKVNDAPISDSTNYLARDADAGQTLEYSIRPVRNGQELAACKPWRFR